MDAVRGPDWGMPLQKFLPDLAGLWRRGLWVLPVFCLGSLLAYWPVRNVPFLSDDYAALGTFFSQGFYWTWGEYPQLFFLPLFVLSHWADLQVWGLDPLPHHVVNMLWHGANAALVTWFARFWLDRTSELGPQRIGIAAFFAGALFLVLPTHTEAVAYICRSDLLATFFSLIALNAWVRYLDQGGAGYGALTLAALAAGLFSKESAISMLPAFGILGVCLWGAAAERRPAASRIGKMLAAAVVVIAAFYAVRFAFIRTWVGVYGFRSEWLDPAVWLPNLGRTLWRMFVPVLSLEHAETLWRLPGWVGWGFGMGSAGLLAWGVWRPSRAFGSTAPAWGLAGLALCGLVCTYPTVLWNIRLDSVEGERWLYLPTVFSCIGLVGLGMRVLPGRRTWLVFLSALVLLYATNLPRVLRYWTEAGEMVRVILNDTAGLVSHEHLLVLNLPNDLKGAYVFRIGFAAALLTFEPRYAFDRLEKIARSPEAMADPVLRAALARFLADGDSVPVSERLRRAGEVLDQGASALTPAAVRARELLRQLRKLRGLTWVGMASFHTCRTPQDRVRVRSAFGGVDLQVDPPNIFVPMPVPEGMQTTLTGPQTAELRFAKGLPADVDVLYWDEGRIKRWDPGGDLAGSASGQGTQTASYPSPE